MTRTTGEMQRCFSMLSATDIDVFATLRSFGLPYSLYSHRPWRDYIISLYWLNRRPRRHTEERLTQNHHYPKEAAERESFACSFDVSLQRRIDPISWNLSCLN